MAPQARGVVPGVARHQKDLFRHLLPQRRLAGQGSVSGQEGAAHVQAVQPHLAGQVRFVAVAAAGTARDAGILGIHGVHRPAVTGIAGGFPHGKQQIAWLDVIQFPGHKVPGRDIGAQDGIQPAPGVVQKFLVSIQLPDLEHPPQEHPLVVVEMPFGGQVLWRKPPHHRLAGPPGQRHRIVHETPPARFILEDLAGSIPVL